jgi:hypothetical protein
VYDQLINNFVINPELYDSIFNNLDLNIENVVEDNQPLNHLNNADQCNYKYFLSFVPL